MNEIDWSHWKSTGASSSFSHPPLVSSVISLPRSCKVRSPSLPTGCIVLEAGRPYACHPARQQHDADGLGSKSDSSDDLPEAANTTPAAGWGPPRNAAPGSGRRGPFECKAAEAREGRACEERGGGQIMARIPRTSTSRPARMRHRSARRYHDGKPGRLSSWVPKDDHEILFEDRNRESKETRRRRTRFWFRSHRFRRSLINK